MKSWKLAVGAALAALALASCSSGSDTATVSFELTDAPVGTQDVQSVFVKFGGLEINESGTAAEGDGSWIEVPIDAEAEYDLLSLTSGVTALLGEVPLAPATQVNQIRFLDPEIAIVETADPATRIPCVLASATGLKIVNAFAVPSTGSITLTVDFDVRKSLVYTSGEYRMKPALRAVAEGEAGAIAGELAEGYAVYAYKDGSYDAEAEEADGDADGILFENSVTGATPHDVSGVFRYMLAFLEPGTYDLVVLNLGTAAVDSSTYADIAVESGATTHQDIAILP